jgi:hypothetical protein
VATTTKPEQAEPDAVSPSEDVLERRLKKLPGWDPVRRRLVHTADPGKQALALVREAATKAKRG